ncbi:MAG: ABC transporter substrate-binding protein [Clostridia bacterium]|nr:ABC transporter substrate-binding protein [Clostridia bacterium]
MMKRLMTLLLVLAMLLTGTAVAEAETSVTVGTVSRPSGMFFTEQWGSNTADIDARTLLHGMSTVTWDADLDYRVDSKIVREVKTRTDGEGNKTYTFKIRYNLAFSDGSPLTAKDYVFSILLQSSPDILALGADNLAYAHLLGYEEYASGQTNVHAGVRLIDSHTFSVCIKEEYIPYFYELTLANVTPYPMAVIAPDCHIKTGTDGSWITGPYSLELLQETILDPETGYLSHPSVTSGPYSLETYDDVSGTATFVRNPHYAGNYEGQKPSIDRLVLREVKYDEALSLLQSGEVDILNKLSSAEIIDAGLVLAGEGAIASAAYDRSGYGFVALACEDAVTGSTAVRQAMAHCLDKQALIDAYLAGYGKPVHSYYGQGQWMVQQYEGDLADVVTTYPVDTAAAAALLEQDGWTLNASGEPYAEGVRYKKLEDGTLQPLAIRFAKLASNDAAQWLSDNYAPVLESVGFQWEPTELAFNELLTHYYRQTERTYNAMFLATNFGMVFDPAYAFDTSEAAQGIYNTSGILDDELAQHAWNLRSVAPGDYATYEQHWLQLLKRFSDVLPTLPIYTNTYYDFFSTRIQGYAPDANWSWACAILYTTVK